MKSKPNAAVRYLVHRPLSFIYGMVVAVRNRLYDLEVCKSESAEIPTIGIGNITVGGTGKTPHAEYIISLLKDTYSVAYLSRGYHRCTSGFVMADEKSTAKTIGDEAFQVQSGFPGVTVAVCPDRLEGICEICDRRPDTEVVVLDDAYQHRRLRIGLNILLIDNNRLTYRDFMLPFGELRESYKNTDRADIIIITKCPDNMLPVDCLSIRKRISPFPYQKMYFTRYIYAAPRHLFSDKTTTLDGKNVLAVTGIASPEPLHKYIRNNAAGLEKMVFDDHHSFSAHDISQIARRLAAMPEGSIVLITDKDRAKLQRMEMPDTLRKSIYSVSVGVDFMFNGEDDFKKQILNYMSPGKI